MKTPNIEPRIFLTELLQAAIQSADPRHCLADYLPEEKDRPAIVIGAGKAAASMAKALEEHWRGPLRGLVVTRYGHGIPCDRIEVVEAAHPVPDVTGEQAARRMLDMVTGLTKNDWVLCLISGGGSSLLSLPAPGLSLLDKQRINRDLLKSGATIGEINAVRKHLSAIKGGRLAKACSPAKVITLAISDVPGDDPAVIASGPTVADLTTRQDAQDILARYTIQVPPSVHDWLNNPASETIKPTDPIWNRTSFQLIATPHRWLQAAAALARAAGITPLVLGDSLEGESREVAKVHAGIANYISRYGQPIKPPCVILSGGETTVTVKGHGRGGRNTEFLLALANCLKGHPHIYALAADTDGIDGSEDNAGAFLSPQSWQRALEARLDPSAMLDNNDSYGFFAVLDDLLTTGPTLTNVNDFRAVLVLPISRGFS
jgi:glycerate 2-kinase